MRARALALAEDLGTTTAQMHRHLAAALGAGAPQPPAELARALRRRAAWALQEVPALAERLPGLHEAVDEVPARVAGLDRLDPPTRIHGDYHLGQVLHEVAGPEAGEGRWFVLDFEGEPLRPLAERSRADQPLRDVAGMLRSFDYAAAVGGAADRGWLDAVRAAYLSAYEESSPERDGTGRRVATTLLAALELDKALYEAVYEARNRPDWLEIPLRGLQRLLNGPAPT